MPINPDSKKAGQIVSEITEKSDNYEKRMSTRLARWTEIAEYFNGKTYTVRDNAKVSHNSAELYKACRAIANMKYRMLTGQKPFFELTAMDIIGHSDPGKLLKMEHYASNQLELSRFDKGLYHALFQQELYGTIAVHETYEPLRNSYLGQKRYITTYRPISLINCAFAIDSYDVEEAGWVCINDIQSKAILKKLLNHDPDGKMYNLKNIKTCLDEPDYEPRVNEWVNQRMAWQGYTNGNFEGGIERSTYYGPLDCLDDGNEYCVEIVNRKHIIRMEIYEGIRPVRIATINNIDIEPLGNGQGDIFRPLLGQLDDVRSYLLNTVAFAGANMFAKQKSYGEEDMEFSIRNFGLVNLENPNLTPLGPNPSVVAQLAAYEDRLTKQYRNGSGASDVLQAVVNNESATATEVSLAMNEAVRNISVAAEQAARPLVADHIKVIFQNAQKYNTEPFTINIKGVPLVIEPTDLQIDVDVRVKTVTDQDFRPARIRNLMNTLQIMNSMAPNAMNGYKINPTPALVELLKLMDVPDWANSVQPINEADLIRAQVMAQIQPQSGMIPVGTKAEATADAGMPSKYEQRSINRGEQNTSDTVSTPAGDVLSAPGDQAQTNQAIRSSSVRP